MLLIIIKMGLAFKIDQRSANMSSLWKKWIVAWYHAKAGRWDICASAFDHDGSGFRSGPESCMRALRSQQFDGDTIARSLWYPNHILSASWRNGNPHGHPGLV